MEEQRPKGLKGTSQRCLPHLVATAKCVKICEDVSSQTCGCKVLTTTKCFKDGRNMKHGSKCSTQLGRNRQEPDMDKEHHEYRNTGMNSILDEEAAFYTMQSHFCESIPSSIRTLVGSMPSANFVRLRAFNILQHPSTSFNILQHPSSSFHTCQHHSAPVPHACSGTSA